MQVLPQRVLLALLFLIPLSVTAGLPGPLIEADWLVKNADKAVILDIQEEALFQRHHMEGAVNWPFSQWRTDASDKTPKSLLPLDQVAKKLGSLGISDDKAVIIVATGTGPADLSAAGRVYWTLKVIGHKDVAVLNGGLVSFVNEHHGKFVRGPADTPKATNYKGQPNMDLVATSEWIMRSDAPRLDARTLAEKVGLVAGQGERSGTIPGAKHLPYDWLALDGGGKIRPVDEIRALFEYAGVPKGKGAVHFCHTANRASLTWFVDYALLGNKDARLYDGSMLEWGKDTTLPIEQELVLP